MEPLISDPAIAARKRWMAVLARASTAELGQAWSAITAPPTFRWLKPAEVGLVMLRARVGGSGARFNVGEAAVTRCVVRTADGYTGVGYILGRERRRAELAALFDALLQNSARRRGIEQRVLEPLATSQQRRQKERSRKSAATKVDFYTLVRGEDD